MTTQFHASRYCRIAPLFLSVAGLATSTVLVVDYLRWPMHDMGGIVARGLILCLLAMQLIPVAGIGLVLLGKRRFRGRTVVCWVWAAAATMALVVGGLGACAFFR